MIREKKSEILHHVVKISRYTVIIYLLTLLLSLLDGKSSY
jgi:hypothetical protein